MATVEVVDPLAGPELLDNAEKQSIHPASRHSKDSPGCAVNGTAPAASRLYLCFPSLNVCFSFPSRRVSLPSFFRLTWMYSFRRG